MLNPSSYLTLEKEFFDKETPRDVKIAIAYIQKEMIDFAARPVLPWVEIIVPTILDKKLREEISKRYKAHDWFLIASKEEEEAIRFIFCTKKMTENWENLCAESISKDNWLIIK